MKLRSASRLIAPLQAACLFVGLVLLLAAPTRAATPGSVVILPTSGVVDQVMAGYLNDGIARAHRDGAAAVVVRLDTPGGSLDSTREIVKTLLEAPLPVVVWVAPSGSRAASAGTFITLAAHVAAMAPGTNIGAATPVDGQGADIEGALGDKVMNDAIASITAIAESRDRPVDWAVSTVQDAESYTVDQALEAGAIDLKVASIEQLLTDIDGMTVQVNGQPVTLATDGAPTEDLPMNPLQAFLHLLTDPNIAFILFTIGFYGIIFELQNPNFVTGILGAIALILAFIGFGSLPLNVGGLLLIGLSAIMFVLELTVTSHGLLAIAGIVCFALGAAALYTEPGTPTAPDVQVAVPIIVAMTALTAAFMSLVVYFALRTHKLAPVAIGGMSQGPIIPVGTPAAVRRPLAPEGSVYAVGEEWTARTVEGTAVARGSPVRVVGQDGLTLLVEPADASIASV
ncbi:MAG: nodulation protein NfeD [Chloroflexota bacterium]|nr:nodulation protein NfeD [Chloroflexota bacterium]